MKIQVLTLFPEMFEGFQGQSIIKRALGKGVATFEAVQIRSFTKDRYGRTDTPSIGGGAGLIQKAQPIVDAIEEANGKAPGSRVLLMSPRGKTFSQDDARRLSKEGGLILVCGHYEGVDERVSSFVDEEVSMGDFVLTGGEIPAMAIADSVIRLLDGAIANESLGEESFNEPLLEYPQWTEPYEYRGMKVPDILYSGNHEAIRLWRRREQLRITRERRPDLFERLSLTKEDRKLLEELDGLREAKWEKAALEKGRRFLHKEED